MGRTNHSPRQLAAMKHNQLIGLAVAIQKQATLIMGATTPSGLAKMHASAIWGTAKDLERALRTERIDK
jgi:hypothetical protein